MKLNDSSQTPLYYQLKQVIKEEINRGKFSPGQKLSTETDLCETYGVSRITARRAISDLVDEGVLHRQQGKGTYVKDFRMKRQLVSVGSFSEITSAQGKTPRTQVLSSKTIYAEDKLKRVFNVKTSTRILKLHRLLYVDDDPFIIETSYYPLDRLPDLEKYIDVSQSTYSILNDKYNINIESSEKNLNVVAATDYEAELFNCDIGASLYSIEKTAFDQNKRPIHLSDSLFLTNKVTFTLNINRNDTIEE